MSGLDIAEVVREAASFLAGLLPGFLKATADKAGETAGSELGRTIVDRLPARLVLPKHDGSMAVPAELEPALAEAAEHDPVFVDLLERFVRSQSSAGSVVAQQITVTNTGAGGIAAATVAGSVSVTNNIRGR